MSVLASANRARMHQDIEANPLGRSARLQRVLHMKNTSSIALRQVLQELNADAAPSRGEMTDVAQARFSSIRHVIVLPSQTGEPLDWEICNPALLVSMLVSASGSLQEVFARALLTSPSSPERMWNMLIGFDEFVPGNKLALQNSRKCMVLSFGESRIL